MRRLGYEILVLRSSILLVHYMHWRLRTQEFEHLRAHNVRFRGQDHNTDKTPAGTTLRSIKVFIARRQYLCTEPTHPLNMIRPTACPIIILRPSNSSGVYEFLFCSTCELISNRFGDHRILFSSLKFTHHCYKTWSSGPNSPLIPFSKKEWWQVYRRVVFWDRGWYIMLNCWMVTKLLQVHL